MTDSIKCTVGVIQPAGYAAPVIYDPANPSAAFLLGSSSPLPMTPELRAAIDEDMQRQEAR